MEGYAQRGNWAILAFLGAEGKVVMNVNNAPGGLVQFLHGNAPNAVLVDFYNVSDLWRNSESHYEPMPVPKRLVGSREHDGGLNWVADQTRFFVG